MLRYLSDPEFNIVLERVTVFEGKTTCAARMALSTILGLHGLRCGKVAGLHVGDLDAGQGALHVATLKKGRPQRVEVEARIAAWLARIAGRQPASLFRTLPGPGVAHEPVPAGVEAVVGALARASFAFHKDARFANSPQGKGKPALHPADAKANYHPPGAGCRHSGHRATAGRQLLTQEATLNQRLFVSIQG
jgi:hypothetical protein